MSSGSISLRGEKEILPPLLWGREVLIIDTRGLLNPMRQFLNNPEVLHPSPIGFSDKLG
jgi:hypothetical protein